MTTINLNGIVGWDIMAVDIQKQLKETTGDITFELNSGGGYVVEGIAILNAIRNYSKGKTIANISFAASMMTQIALSCDEINAYDNAIFMIHNTQGCECGDYRDMRNRADIMKRMTKNLAKLYVKKTGKTEAEISKLMNEETYFFGDEIKEAGFCHNMIETDKAEATTKDEAYLKFDKMLRKTKEFKRDENLTIKQLKEQMILCKDGSCEMNGSYAPSKKNNDDNLADKPSAKVEKETDTKPISRNKGIKMEDKNIEATTQAEIKTKVDEAVALKTAEAIASERNRIIEINALSGSQETKDKAIADGMSVGDLAIVLNKEQAEIEAEKMEAAAKDFKNTDTINQDETDKDTDEVSDENAAKIVEGI